MTGEQSPQLVSQAAYARMRGVTRQSINELVKRRVIHLTPSGKIDAAQADEAIASRLDPARSKSQQSISFAGAAGAAGRAPRHEPGNDGVGSRKDRQNDFQDARTLREQSEAALAHLELEKAYGTVVDREGVHRGAMEAGRTLRDRLMAVGVHLAPTLAVKTDPGEIGRMIDAEIRRALDDCMKLIQSNLGKLAQ